MKTSLEVHKNDSIPSKLAPYLRGFDKHKISHKPKNKAKVIKDVEAVKRNTDKKDALTINDHSNDAFAKTLEKVNKQKSNITKNEILASDGPFSRMIISTGIESKPLPAFFLFSVSIEKFNY